MKALSRIPNGAKLLVLYIGGIALVSFCSASERKPYTCEDAKNDLHRAELSEASEWKRLEEGRSPSMGAANIAIQDAKAAVRSAESVVSSTCK